MNRARRTWRRLCITAAVAAHGVTALTEPDLTGSGPSRWLRLCLFMNHRFPDNVIFPRKETQMTGYAIIKRRSSDPVPEPEICDRCGARALWKIIIPRSESASTTPATLFMCNHHREEHAPHIASRGYAEERLPAPVMQG